MESNKTNYDAFYPFEGWRTVEVTERRTAVDYAQLLKKLVDDYYPESRLITVVQDNLNTHTPASGLQSL